MELNKLDPVPNIKVNIWTRGYASLMQLKETLIRKYKSLFHEEVADSPKPFNEPRCYSFQECLQLFEDFSDACSGKDPFKSFRRLHFLLTQANKQLQLKRTWFCVCCEPAYASLTETRLVMEHTRKALQRVATHVKKSEKLFLQNSIGSVMLDNVITIVNLTFSIKHFSKHLYDSSPESNLTAFQKCSQDLERHCTAILDAINQKCLQEAESRNLVSDDDLIGLDPEEEEDFLSVSSEFLHDSLSFKSLSFSRGNFSLPYLSHRNSIGY